MTASVSGSIKANHSAVSFTLYDIIMRLHCFIFIIIYILRSHELCPLTDHIFNSWVYVWFIWIIWVAVHRQKWMTLKMALFLYNKLKQGISWTRCETSSCNESQHFGRCYSFLWPLGGHSMNRFKKPRIMNLFPIQLDLKLHWFRTFHFEIATYSLKGGFDWGLRTFGCKVYILCWHCAEFI